jgi:WD40 repeat protein
MNMTLRYAFFAALLVASIVTPRAIAQEDYAKYRVLDTKVIQNMWAGPGQSAALLSLDGSRLLHLSNRSPDMCLYAPAQIGSWVELACSDYTKDNRPGEAQDMFWSPVGDRLLMPTRHDAFARFRDTDIRIFDADTLTVQNLTDDGFDGTLLEGNGPAELDILAHWFDDNSIVFVRNSVPPGGTQQGTSTSLMTIAADGGEPVKLLDIPSSSSLPVSNLTVSSDSKLLAYSFEDRGDAENDGIYLLTLGTTTPTRVAKMSQLDGMRLLGLAFSADSKFLLLLGGTGDGRNTSRVLNLATGDIVPVDANQNITGIAWSPTGSALVYTTLDASKPKMPGGLFLAPAPGRPARLLIGEAFYPPACCGNEPFIWASNDTLVLPRLGDTLGSVLYIQLGE